MASHENAKAPCARRRDVEPVRAVKKLHAARRIGMARRRHRIDDDRRFLSLKLVDRADARAGQPLLQLEDLRVVWRDDQDVVERDGRLTYRPGRSRSRSDSRISATSSLIASASSGRRALIALVARRAGYRKPVPDNPTLGS